MSTRHRQVGSMHSWSPYAGLGEAAAATLREEAAAIVLLPPAERRAAIDAARNAGRKVAFTLSDNFVIDRHRADFIDLIEQGLIDILFTENGTAKLTAYLAIGVDQNDTFTREFHGPVQFDMCSGPSELRIHDFDQDGCEDVVVLCKSASAVAILANRTCAVQAEQASAP